MGFYVCTCDIIQLFNGYIKYVHQKNIFVWFHYYTCVYVCVRICVYIFVSQSTPNKVGTSFKLPTFSFYT